MLILPESDMSLTESIANTSVLSSEITGAE
jgi:hypothetical protein